MGVATFGVGEDSRAERRDRQVNPRPRFEKRTWGTRFFVNVTDKGFRCAVVGATFGLSENTDAER
jgi:hypothetical protein